ncbi:unnamed protein product [Heligmosomoides polygyrus]|uniref:DUF5641 domain-containing protein n=1 Tax=Heligmosomoides polygyrus TaxID=6339 RepID=A0A183FNZ1_HELPZ|nr:unnamed protein product [Heligmosomoides polygyrus]
MLKPQDTMERQYNEEIEDPFNCHHRAQTRRFEPGDLVWVRDYREGSPKWIIGQCEGNLKIVVTMCVPPLGATGNCSFLRAKPNTDIRMQATGPCDRPAYEDPCYIAWCMTVQVSRDSATASAGADAHSQSPASVESMRGTLMQGWHRGQPS